MTVVWPQPHQAMAAFRAGERANALAIADAVLASDPYCADALLTRAMVRLAEGRLDPAIPDLMAAAELRSGHWLLEKLRVELMSRSALQLNLTDAMRLGALVRSRLPVTGAVRTGTSDPEAAPFVNVLGGGATRSFGGHAAFLPVTIASDRNLLFLTDTAAARTHSVVLDHVARIDAAKPTVLAFGADAVHHLRNTLGTRTAGGAQIGDQDLDAMAVVAARHKTLLSQVRGRMRGLLMLLGAMPGPDDRVNTLGRHLNRCLAQVCRETGVPLLDWWGDFADGTTGRLSPQYAANAYPGDPHLSRAAVQVFVPRLKKLGVLGPGVKPEARYEWSHVFECIVGGPDRTRIWCEPEIAPADARASLKVAMTQAHRSLADLVSATLIATGAMSALYINVRDGFLPLAMPNALVSRAIALTRSDDDLQIARAVTDFWGRSDIDLMRATPETSRVVALMQPALVIACTHPDTAGEDVAAINALIEAGVSAQTLVVTTSDGAVVGQLKLDAYRLQARAPIGTPTMPAPWPQATALLFARKA